MNIPIVDYVSYKTTSENALGEGSFGCVYKRNNYAFKISKDVMLTCDAYLFNLIREISVMVTLNKYSVVPKINKIELGRRTCFHMELFEYTLNDVFKNDELLTERLI